jgi:hypothetical protein
MVRHTRSPVTNTAQTSMPNNSQSDTLKVVARDAGIGYRAAQREKSGLRSGAAASVLPRNNMAFAAGQLAVFQGASDEPILIDT